MAYMDTTHSPLDRITALRKLYRLPQTYALLIESLLTSEVITVEELVAYGVAPSVASARVVMHKVRKAFFDKREVKVEQQQSLGYWLSKEAKEAIERELVGFTGQTYPAGKTDGG